PDTGHSLRAENDATAHFKAEVDNLKSSEYKITNQPDYFKPPHKSGHPLPPHEYKTRNACHGYQDMVLGDTAANALMSLKRSENDPNLIVMKWNPTRDERALLQGKEVDNNPLDGMTLMSDSLIDLSMPMADDSADGLSDMSSSYVWNGPECATMSLQAMIASSADTWKRALDYLIAQWELFCAMCLGRQYVAIQELQKQYPADMVLHMVCNPDLSYRLRAVCAKFLLHLHVDCDPQTNIPPIQRVRIWTDIKVGGAEENDDIPLRKTEVHTCDNTESKEKDRQLEDKLMGIKAYVDQVLEMDDSSANAKNVNRHAFTESVKTKNTDAAALGLANLDLLEALIRFGFYSHNELLRVVVSPIGAYLHGF
ncbi:hypothetical protein SARC_11893, partial [Sphaeroforma arctica JP610]